MKCDKCDNEAVKHLIKVVDGQVQKVHLCDSCAQKLDEDFEDDLSVTDVLLGMGKPSLTPDVEPFKTEHACPDCGMTIAEFKKHGRLGCASCYTTFMDKVEQLAKGIHQNTQHVGKVSGHVACPEGYKPYILHMEKLLAEAIALEHFEDAAFYRDQLAHCEALLKKNPEVFL